MDKLEFIRKLDSGSEIVTDKTAELWFHIFGWVEARGYADTADSPDFIKHVQSFRHVTVATIGRHLARMADAGLLRAHALRRQLPPEVKEEVASSLTGLIFGGGASTLPTAFTRYTLPDSPCPREFKSANNLLERNRRFDDEMREQMPASFVQR